MSPDVNSPYHSAGSPCSSAKYQPRRELSAKFPNRVGDVPRDFQTEIRPNVVLKTKTPATCALRVGLLAWLSDSKDTASGQTASIWYVRISWIPDGMYVSSISAKWTAWRKLGRLCTRWNRCMILIPMDLFQSWHDVHGNQSVQ